MSGAEGGSVWSWRHWTLTAAGLHVGGSGPPGLGDPCDSVEEHFVPDLRELHLYVMTCVCSGFFLSVACSPSWICRSMSFQTLRSFQPLSLQMLFQPHPLSPSGTFSPSLFSLRYSHWVISLPLLSARGVIHCLSFSLFIEVLIFMLCFYFENSLWFFWTCWAACDGILDPIGMFSLGRLPLKEWGLLILGGMWLPASHGLCWHVEGGVLITLGTGEKPAPPPRLPDTSPGGQWRAPSMVRVKV